MPVISQSVGRKGIHREMFPSLERNDTNSIFRSSLLPRSQAKDRLGPLKLRLIILI